MFQTIEVTYSSTLKKNNLKQKYTFAHNSRSSSEWFAFKYFSWVHKSDLWSHSV